MLQDIKITVITVVYNDVNHIERTIKSIIGQTYKSVEYIVIDGGSTDGTVELIQRYRLSVDFFSSEKDSGIYDAMNKGIDKATGDYVIFINSGDIFSSNQILASIFSDNVEKPDMIYGDIKICYNSSLYRVQKAKDLKFLDYGIPFCHQSLFVNAELLKRIKFDARYKLAADYKFVIDCFKLGYSFYYTQKVVAIISAGGASDNNLMVIKEYAMISNSNNPSVKKRIYFNYLFLRVWSASLIKHLLPWNLTKLIIRWK